MQEKTTNVATVWRFSEVTSLLSSNGGADGIDSGFLNKTQEKPLNIRAHCHLLILALSLGNPQRPF
jgi:hypothetical protein